MKKGFILSSVVLGLMVAVTAAVAAQTKSGMQLTTPGTEKVLLLPSPADNSRVISLGTAIDPQSGQMVEGYAILHPKEAAGKPDHAVKPDKKPKPDAVSTCYAFLAKGAKWKTVEPWVVNPANLHGLSGDYVFGNLDMDVAKWEDAADGSADGAMGADILGGGFMTELALEADSVSPDGVNEVYFGDIDSPGTIAVTIVWGVFGGPPQNRQLVEWDMVFDEADYAWSSAGEAGKMDFENIATHELGHSAGLGHPEDTCVEETMYRFADFGETYKRDLHAGDIAGIDKLY